MCSKFGPCFSPFFLCSTNLNECVFPRTICEENEYERNEEKGGEDDQMDGVAEKVQCMTLLWPETNKKGEVSSLVFCSV